MSNSFVARSKFTAYDLSSYAFLIKSSLCIDFKSPPKTISLFYILDIFFATSITE